MNAKTMWIPLAFVALTFAATAGAQDPASSPTSDPASKQAGEPAAQGRMQDLCAVELDQFGDPARCDATGPQMAPWWDAEVCCDNDSCMEPTSKGCMRGYTSYWCESAELRSDGTLTCLYEVPNYCDVYPCATPTDITIGPVEHAICCFDAGCYDHEGGPCGGIEVWCGDGNSNDDGTVTCHDW